MHQLLMIFMREKRKAVIFAIILRHYQSENRGFVNEMMEREK